MKRLPAVLAVAVLLAAVALADKKPDQYSDLSFTVLKNENGKPVRNASVILHPVGKDGKQERGGFQVKTDAEGKTTAPSVPYGKLRVQVIAPGFQTFGEDYEINQPTHGFTIKLKRPQEQYSIYK